jgi:threonine dehydrogenase-like Zn-dependent dehydrogenase
VRQLTMSEERTVDWREVPEPELEGPRDAVVRPLAVALCDLDQPILRGEAPFPGPIALGHEFVAEVVAAGDDAGLEVGRRVVVPFQISCGACARCLRGQTGDCEAVPAYSSYGFGAFGGAWGGALSDLVRIPFADFMAVPLPDELAPATAAGASDNLPDAWRTVAPALETHPGGRVLIMGGLAESIGLYAVDIALALGAESVTYHDDDGTRLEVAEQLGAEAVEGPPPHRLGPYPITVNASVDRAALTCALRSTEPGGICTSAGIMFEPETPLPLLEMYTTGVHFHTGRCHARPAMPGLLELIAGGRLKPDLVTSNVVDWEDAPQAVQTPERKLVIDRS